MQLQVKNKKLKRALEDDTECRKQFGQAMAKKIRLRIDALSAAESLGDFWPPYSGPERCHELKGEFTGMFSVDVKQPYRLLFRPVDFEEPDPEGEKEEKDERQRWLIIQSIEILSIEDTHG